VALGHYYSEHSKESHVTEDELSKATVITSLLYRYCSDTLCLAITSQGILCSVLESRLQGKAFMLYILNGCSILARMLNRWLVRSGCFLQ
jgi:hypothetical protein